jgi:integrase
MTAESDFGMKEGKRMKHELLKLLVQTCLAVAIGIITSHALHHTRFGQWVDAAADWVKARAPWMRMRHLFTASVVVAVVALVLEGHLS